MQRWILTPILPNTVAGRLRQGVELMIQHLMRLMPQAIPVSWMPKTVFGHPWKDHRQCLEHCSVAAITNTTTHDRLTFSQQDHSRGLTKFH